MPPQQQVTLEAQGAGTRLGERVPTHLAMVSTPSFTLSRSLLNVWIFMMEAATGSVEKCWEEGRKCIQPHSPHGLEASLPGGSSDSDNTNNGLTAGRPVAFNGSKCKGTRSAEKEDKSPFEDAILCLSPSKGCQQPRLGNRITAADQQTSNRTVACVIPVG